MAKRKIVSLHDKSMAIEAILSGKSRKEISISLGVSLPTISQWLKHRKKIVEHENRVLNSTCVKRIKQSPYDIIEKVLLTWINGALSDGIILNGLYVLWSISSISD